MNQDVNVLQWENCAIPHHLWVEKSETGGSRLGMKIIKDVEPEILYLDLPVSPQQVMGAWQGRAYSISDEFNDGNLFSQVRSLVNLPQGCVIWTVNHIRMPNGSTMSADKLALVPGMKQSNGGLESV